MLELAKAATAPKDGRNKRWIDRLDAAQRVELETLRDAWQRGELPEWTARQIYEVLLPQAKINPRCCVGTWRKWMNGDGV